MVPGRAVRRPAAQHPHELEEIDASRAVQVREEPEPRELVALDGGLKPGRRRFGVNDGSWLGHGEMVGSNLVFNQWLKMLKVVGEWLANG